MHCSVRYALMKHRWRKIADGFKHDGPASGERIMECRACDTRIVLPPPNGHTRFQYYKKLGIEPCCQMTNVRKVMDS